MEVMNAGEIGATTRPWLRFGVFSVFTLLFSWPYWFGVIASENGWVRMKVPLGPWGSFGPAVAALVVAGIFDGRAGLRCVFSRFRIWRVGAGYYAIALFGMAAVLGICLLAAVLTGSKLPSPENLDRCYLVLPLVVVAVLILGGPLGEEIGWRGYALPVLLGRLGPVSASLVVGLIWLVWHLPLFWMPGSGQAGTPIHLFGVILMSYSVVFTWLYLKTNGSLLIAILFHTGINTAQVVLGAVLPGIDAAPGYAYTLLMSSVVIAVSLAIIPGIRPDRRVPIVNPGGKT